MSGEFEIEFRWKEEVIYWEGSRGAVFQGAWGVDPPITVVPDAESWDSVVPEWLRGRRNEVVDRLLSEPKHVLEEHGDQPAPAWVGEATR